jgi:hypothetical protein
MTVAAQTIKSPIATAVAVPLASAARKPLVEYVRRSLELDDPEEMDRRADELMGIGYEKTADHLRDQANLLRAGRPQDRRALYKSPLPEASDEQWARFVRLMQTGDVAAVTPTGQVGLFQTRLKRLEDLGLARDVRRVAVDGGARWMATFRAPLSLQRLLSDPLLQYRIFAASMRRYRDEILSHDRGALGRQLEGRRVTLSGLLAVAHHAGPALASWLANAQDRQRFARTTSAYQATTEVF